VFAAELSVDLATSEISRWPQLDERAVERVRQSLANGTGRRRRR
jgi:hypothetical protein